MREPGCDVNRFAIPALHFRSAHPETLKMYADLGSDPKPGLRDHLARWRDCLGGHHGLPDVAPRENCDLLFVSHLTAADQWRQTTTDPYFGTLPWELQSMGRACRMALIDHTNVAFGDLATPAATAVPKSLLPRRLERSAEMAMAQRLAHAAADLRSGTAYPDLRRLAARQAGLGPARQALRIATAIARLVGQHRPKALILTYEGHAWERMTMHMSRKAQPGLRCIAVHHAILAPMQHAMTTRYGGTFDPDVILAAGQAAYDWLSAAPGLGGIVVDLLGSPRAKASAPSPTELKDGSACLFLPEGMISESCRLAEAAYALALARPDLTCVIRLHPLTSRAALTAAQPRLREPPPNVDWSPPERALEEDGRRATWAVYRGSSAVLSAMTLGAVPVYLGDEPAELRIDPLRGAGDIVQVVSHSSQLAAALDARKIYLEQLHRGWTYAQSYYTPMNPTAILQSMITPVARQQTAPEAP